MDKTGTLTCEKPELTEVTAFGGFDEYVLLSLVAVANGPPSTRSDRPPS